SSTGNFPIKQSLDNQRRELLGAGPSELRAAGEHLTGDHILAAAASWCGLGPALPTQDQGKGRRSLLGLALKRRQALMLPSPPSM
ncbi:hypothetical protein P7K49_002557, partial [Saguinus oedipus]